MTSTPAPVQDLAATVAPDPLPALRHQRPYRLWWISDTSALLAGSIYQFAVPLLLLAATGSPAQAGALAALGTAARIGLVLTGGSLADRTSRSRLIMLGGLIGAALTGTLALIAWIGTLGAAVLCAAHILLELRGGLFGTATDAALKDVVPPRQLGRAMAANQGRDAALSLGGAPLGGLLLGLGAAPALLFVACFQLLTALFGRLLGPALARAEERAAGQGHQPSARGILFGLRWCFARPQLRMMLWVLVAVNLGTNGVVTTLVYGLRYRGESTVVIGLVTACLGVGLLLGSLLATWLIDRIATGVLACLALSTLSLCLLLLAVDGRLWWLGTLLAAAFLSVPALNAAVGGYFMALVPRDMAGRANSVIMFMALLAMPLAPVLAGAGVELVGMPRTLVFFSLLTVLATLASWSSRRIRTIPGPEHWQQSPGDAAGTASAIAVRPGARRTAWDVRALRERRMEPHGQHIYL